MARYAALLRGVNVGGRNKVAMPDLRALFESLGHRDVATYIQSGNVVFASTTPVKPNALESAIESALGIDITVVLRTASELKKVVATNPYAGADPTKLHVGFMAAKLAVDATRKLDVERFRPDEVVLHGREMYLHLPNGMGRSKLPAYLDRQLKVPTTVRSWKTVTKLLELTSA